MKEPRFNGKETRTVLYLGKDNTKVVETRTYVNDNDNDDQQQQQGRDNNTILLCRWYYFEPKFNSLLFDVIHCTNKTLMG